MADKNIDPASETREKNFSAELKEMLCDLREAVARDDNSRESWKRKLTIATNQRLGVKRVTNHPYPGAPNIPLPETDKQIRKKKPAFVLAVMGQDKPVSLGQPMFGEAVAPEQLKLAEDAFNEVLKGKLGLLKKLTRATDNFMEKGFCIFKVIENFHVEELSRAIDTDRYSDEQKEAFRSLSRIEQEQFIAENFDLDLEDELGIIKKIIKDFKKGTRVIEYKVDKIRSFPEILVRDSEKVIFPTYMEDIEQSERVTDEFFLTERELVTKGINGTYDLVKIKKNIGFLNKKGSQNKSRHDDDIVHQQKNNNEGISEDSTADLYKMHETYCWRPTGTDGRYERWVVTFMADVADDVDAAVAVKRYMDEDFPFVKHDNEVKDGRPYSSRGIPEQIRALQQFMEKAINNMLIRDDINNNPVFTVLSSSKLQSSTNRFIPGQVLKVNRHDEVQELGQRASRVDLSSNLIVDKLKAFAEEYLASSDQLFRNATNEGGGKTLGEIKTGIALNQQIQSLELMLWNQSLKRVYQKVWNKLRDGLIKPFRVNGVMITKEVFNFSPEISPTGNIDNIDKQNMLQKAFLRLQQVIQQVQLGVIATPEDLYNAFNDYLEKDGVKDTSRFSTEPQIIQQQNQEAAARQQQLLAQQDQQLARQQAQAEARAGRQGGSVE